MKGLIQLLFAFVLAVSPLLAGENRSAQLIPVPIQQVSLEDAFWAPKLDVWRRVTLPDSLAKFEKDGAFTNFDRIRDGTGDKHSGPPWYDGLIYEMMRAAADFVAAERDPALEARLDGYIERIAAGAARDANGYLNTYTQLEEPDHRWGLNGGNDNWQHDVYNAGAMVEAAVHYYLATGKTRLLEVASRLANHMTDVMGTPPRRSVIPGHSVTEEALVKLYLLFREQPAVKSRMPVAVDETRYLKLAEYWYDNRGHHEGRESFGSYGQDHKPLMQQTTLEGHAVRATLFGAGLVAVADATGRADLLKAAQTLWENMVQRRMYVTGGLGSVAEYEGFGPDYDLPNDGYLETCAAVGAGFWHSNLNLMLSDARYADELERVLYNAVLPGVSLKGDSYFYKNPLAAGGERRRWDWHSCPCCPPMFLKIVAALPGLIYAQGPGAVYVNLYAGSSANLTVNESRVVLRQTTRYPWDGTVRLTLDPEGPTTFALKLRLPDWCGAPHIAVNGTALTPLTSTRGYISLERQWSQGDTVELTLPMPVRRLKAHPSIEANRGRVALQRGPLVYCVEAGDNGGHVRNLVLPSTSELKARHRPDLLGGVTVIEGPALAVHRVPWPEQLYLSSDAVPGITNTVMTAVPYYANANRQAGEMQVWMAESVSAVDALPPPTVASRARATASHCWHGDTVAALNDQIEPDRSDDTGIPRFTWWDHRGMADWVQYEFDRPEDVSAIEVYWWDERRIDAHCRVPESWRLLYRAGDDWRPVVTTATGGTEMDRFNRLEFDPVTTTALRLEVQLQSGWSGGILEWRVE